MNRRTKIGAAIGAALVLGAGGVGAALATGGGDDDASQEAITGQALDRASKAALAHTGGGEVTETEVGDEESFYEVEVTRPDGSQVDVQLDQGFNVVGSSADDESESESGDD